MNGRQLRMRDRMLAATISLVGVMAYALISGALQHRPIYPPDLDLRIGRYRIAAFITGGGECGAAPPATHPQGGYAILVFSPSAEDPSIEIGQTVLEFPPRC